MYLQGVLNISKAVPLDHCWFTFGRHAMPFRIVHTPKTTCMSILSLSFQCSWLRDLSMKPMNSASRLLVSTFVFKHEPCHCTSSARCGRLMLVGFINRILSPSFTNSILPFDGDFSLKMDGVTRKERVNSEGHTLIDSAADSSTRQS